VAEFIEPLLIPRNNGFFTIANRYQFFINCIHHNRFLLVAGVYYTIFGSVVKEVVMDSGADHMLI
jgi:hypothetical protein